MGVSPRGHDLDQNSRTFLTRKLRFQLGVRDPVFGCAQNVDWACSRLWEGSNDILGHIKTIRIQGKLRQTTTTTNPRGGPFIESAFIESTFDENAKWPATDHLQI